MKEEPTQHVAQNNRRDGYPKLVYALDDGRPVEGVCNTPEEFKLFTFDHSFVQACSYVAGISAG